MTESPQASLIVLENFLDSPDIARAAALVARYELIPGGLRYRNAAVPDWLADEFSEKVLRLIGGRFRQRREGVAFRQYLKRDESSNRNSLSWVHFDRFRWIGIVYLNLPVQCRGGTSFFTHKHTGLYRWADLCRQSLDDDQIKDRVFADMAYPDKWVENLHVSMVYNRLVLFDSRMFHQARCYFGSTLKNARLTLNVFFGETSDEEMLRVI